MIPLHGQCTQRFRLNETRSCYYHFLETNLYIYIFSKRYRQNFLVLYKVDLIENRPLDYSLIYMA